jgi:IS30 family transposase
MWPALSTPVPDHCGNQRDIRNENFDGLLRQYLPKGTCMSNVTQARCDQIADDLNQRPRKRYGFETPATLYHRN